MCCAGEQSVNEAERNVIIDAHIIESAHTSFKWHALLSSHRSADPSNVKRDLCRRDGVEARLCACLARLNCALREETEAKHSFRGKISHE